MSKTTAKLNRLAFKTPRSLDFLTKKELVAQVGHRVSDWPFVVLKELVDNALDASEEAQIASVVRVTVDERGITVTDNGPGIPPEVVEQILDFDVRVSSREAYMAPDRGRQGNGLKTMIAIPFVLSGGDSGNVRIEARGIRHRIDMKADRIRQVPAIDHKTEAISKTVGTSIFVSWPNSPADLPRSNEHDQNDDFLQNDDELEEKGDDGEFSPRSKLASAKPRFLQNAVGYAWVNPHLSLTVDWHGERLHLPATNANWAKWRPSDPTDPHWYGVAEFEPLLGANIAWDTDHGRDRSLREFVAEFQGLTGSGKVKTMLDSLGLKRAKLADLAADGALDRTKTEALLHAMKAQTRPIKAKALGIIGEEHLRTSFAASGADMDTFKYRRTLSTAGELPFIIETAFAWNPDASSRRMVTGINWSPAIGANPFRELGSFGKSLDSVLEEQAAAGEDEPVVFLLHIACPKVNYADRGKSSVIVEE